MKNCSQFGIILRKEREKKGIPLWKLAASVPFPASNLQRIETGITEPRICTAMKILATLGGDAGSFMQTLAESQSWDIYQAPERFSAEILAVILEELCAEGSVLDVCPKGLFGIYFRRVRVILELSQSAIATRSDYTTRSLIAVESGNQEPKIMRALQLVWVTGVPVSSFFKLLAQRIK